MSFTVNEHSYKYGYNAKLLTKRQESAKNDIERAFEVLKQTWHVVKYATRLRDKDRIKRMVEACIILHNMIIEDQGRTICTYDPDDVVIPIEEFVPGTTEFLARVVEIHNSETSFNLREDVAKHLYQLNMNGY
ncbi:unnamed protein product [Lactuca virosa]|uniref:DDE Tnp4 domain-containing protein n=1 Tax=Lactuca virosa TaxID=75947 RepID=A0AAU9MSV2_9ASTR|nr:unnamed protein product [Lactuca virosa]